MLKREASYAKLKSEIAIVEPMLFLVKTDDLPLFPRFKWERTLQVKRQRARAERSLT